MVFLNIGGVLNKRKPNNSLFRIAGLGLFVIEKGLFVKVYDGIGVGSGEWGGKRK
jgi:hypothetical protein